jgi:phosphoribosylanthranilate isomerase
VHPSVITVGVFVEAAVDTVLDVVERAGLRGVQLHGDGAGAQVAALRKARPGLFVIQVVRVTGPDALADLDSDADAVMVDPKDPHNLRTRSDPIPVSWLQAAVHPQLIVAGGLTPGNVGEVVRRLHPFGVDVSGGVETSPGRKDPALVSRFVHEVRLAEAE